MADDRAARRGDVARRRLPAPEARPVKLWSWPKIMFLYPTLLAALVAGFGMWQWEDQATTWGVLFLVVFFVNAIVMAFDFPRTTSLNLLLLVIALVLGALLINQRLVVFLPALKELTERVQPQANGQFYWYFAGILAFIYVIVLIIDFRFDYWLVQPNEIIHRRGILGNVSRYPAPGLEFQKDITDVFEYFLLGSGRIVIQPTKGPPIVLDHVPRVNDKERRIRELLDALNVEITAPDPV